ncbi:MAG: hypothetical protein PHR15_03065 [Atopobiaceae bacterium]|jgi:hypothetical protein|nr:hypothetical protein [Atopobiaceae bacterium]MCH4214623.1 hypothetical protein [Atopobiaceae bacterium]MCH4230504.1 hypothetical protein [Atopobiaceae bacterium]MCH4275782.1 hypothetical protein [Atopobiaceae bacterium]MCI1225854.1 hypothetical protein [Atopobiaceae bacterium]
MPALSTGTAYTRLRVWRSSVIKEWTTHGDGLIVLYTGLGLVALGVVLFFVFGGA